MNHILDEPVKRKTVDSASAAQYINFKLAELGDNSYKYTDKTVEELAKQGHIRHDNNEYDFELDWLEDYFNKKYARTRPEIQGIFTGGRPQSTINPSNPQTTKSLRDRVERNRSS